MSYTSESKLLVAWKEFIEKVDPDVIIGYNISNFDFPYLLDRAKALKEDAFPYLGRLRGAYKTFSPFFKSLSLQLRY